MSYQYRAKSTLREQQLAAALERKCHEVELLRDQLKARKRTRRINRRLHPGNGDFGPEAFWAEAQKAYEAALRLPEPIHYRPHEDLEDAA